MNLTGISFTGSLAGEVRSGDNPAKVRDAAEQFEALLIGQILQSAREGSDEKGDAATGFAEQHLANCLARSGGLGIAGMVAKSLKAPGVG